MSEQLPGADWGLIGTEHFGGTWNPTAARFIQLTRSQATGCFTCRAATTRSNKLPHRERHHAYTAHRRRLGLFRFVSAGTIRAPWRRQATPTPCRSVVRRLNEIVAADDPALNTFGPRELYVAKMVMPTSVSTRRMQVKAPRRAQETLGVQFNKVFRFGRQSVEIGGSIFNLLKCTGNLQ